MLRQLLALCALCLLGLPTASRALDCPSPEKQGQTPGGYTICKPSVAGQCGPGRKFTRHPRESVSMCEDGAPAKAKVAPAPAAAPSRCAVGEESTSHKGYDVCKPVGGACGKGRKHEPHHRYPDLIICVDDKNAHAASITCSEHERPVYPNGKIKAFCEPVDGRCGFGRTPVAAEVPNKRMCIAK